MSKRILRVAILNNFNFTGAEFSQLEKYEKDWQIFVNANAKTPIRGKYPAIVTVNPDLTAFVAPSGDLSQIKAVRIKYVSGAKPEVMAAFNESVTWAKEHKIPALITYMRFTTSADLMRFTTDQSNYKWERNYYRQQTLKTWEDGNIHYCDLKKEGCPSCLNCSKLVFGEENDKLFGINLSSSGRCPYSCPSCFSKKLVTRCGLAFDKVTQNSKQKGHKPVVPEGIEVQGISGIRKDLPVGV